jgi:GNAT superfamily N-acetyltransferase
MSGYTVDHAGKGDLPQLVALLAELFNIEQDFMPDAGRQTAGLKLLLARPDQGAVLVGRGSRGRAVGMVTVQLVVSTAQGSLTAWIEDVAVARDHRGRGLGRALVTQALEWARRHGATRAQLLVDLDNAAALAFYGRLGWQATRLSARRIFLEADKKTGAEAPVE